MKHLTKHILFLVIVVPIIISFFSFLVYASKGSPEEKPGTPPKGVAIQSDAQGTKLVGVLYLESYDFRANDNTAAFLRVAVRLRKGNQLETFYADLTCTNSVLLPCDSNRRYDITQTGLIQTAIIDKLKNDILGAFFNGNTNLTITLKLMEEVDWVFVTTQQLGVVSVINISDIELAVK